MLIEKLSNQSGVSVSKLNRLALFASQKYKTYTIPKKTKGERIISQPSRELKAIQRWIVSAIIGKLPVHESATAYRIGRGIRHNAEMHASSLFTVRVDFSEFFPSFYSDGIITFLNENNNHNNYGWSDNDINFIEKIVTRNGRLTIGAPSSPSLTNAMMHEFDSDIAIWALESKIIYTRYADDLFFSSFEPNKLTSVVSKVSEISKNYKYANLIINNDKTCFLSRKYRRSITGLIITPEKKISIGRARKREIQSLIHKLTISTLHENNISRLQGLVAFANDVEPSFIVTLYKKYSKEIVEDIISHAEKRRSHTNSAL